MKSLLKSKKLLIFLADVFFLPSLFLCKVLSDLMLGTSSECLFLRLGGKCVACGGTHFVNSLLNGRVTEAFWHNPYLFVLTIVLAVSFVLLNLYWLFNIKFAGKILSKVYSVPGLVVATSALMVFFIIRIAPMFINAFTLLRQLL